MNIPLVCRKSLYYCPTDVFTSVTAPSTWGVTPHQMPYTCSQFQKSNASSTNPHRQSSIVLRTSNPQAKHDNLNQKSGSFVWDPRVSHNWTSFHRMPPVYPLHLNTIRSGSLTSRSRPEFVNKQLNDRPYGLQNVVGDSTWISGSCGLQHGITRVGTKAKIGLCVPMMVFH